MPTDPRDMTKRAMRPAKIYDAIMGWLSDRRDAARDRVGPAERAVSSVAGGAADKARSLIDKLTS